MREGWEENGRGKRLVSQVMKTRGMGREVGGGWEEFGIHIHNIIFFISSEATSKAFSSASF